ncbi:ABATE domain-containing protein [Roseomonas sp. 18066]|uniref:CGNR zinc finger domain-containing protein n=1 Tax=Roseomonas sp. 18066 TaxID=2681412 RepID=UPI00135A4D9A|nr:ABATE domain-containing protein [Roseomonas sp. 18066]
MNRTIASLPLRGGHPVLDLANTVAARRGGEEEDVLRAPADLLAWAARAGASSEALAQGFADDPAAAGAALLAARGLREALFRIFSALGRDDEPAADDLALVESLAAQAQRRLRRTAAGYEWRWPADPAPMALVHRLALMTAELLVDPRLPRVRECPGHHCGWLFLDTSRGGQRRWCAEADCGVLDRVRRHRARHSGG